MRVPDVVDALQELVAAVGFEALKRDEVAVGLKRCR